MVDSSGAGRPEDGEHLPRGHDEVDIAQGRDLDLPHAVDLVQPLRTEERQTVPGVSAHVRHLRHSLPSFRPSFRPLAAISAR